MVLSISATVQRFSISKAFGLLMLCMRFLTIKMTRQEAIETFIRPKESLEQGGSGSSHTGGVL